MPKNFEFWMPVIAILISPLLAVQVQKWLDAYRDKKKRKKEVFYALMATRAAKVSGEHVSALNRIDIEWFGRHIFGIHHRTKIEREVLAAWKQYFDHLNTPPDTVGGLPVWVAKGTELFTDLLYSISESLGYDFDKVTLKRGVYSPIAHEKLESNQEQIIKGLIAWLDGSRPVAVHIVQTPTIQAPDNSLLPTAHTGPREST